MNKKSEKKKFKKLVKMAEAKNNACSVLCIVPPKIDELLDSILNKLAEYMDRHFNCDDFTKHLYKVRKHEL